MTSILNSDDKSCAIDLFRQGKFDETCFQQSSESSSPIKNECFSTENEIPIENIQFEKRSPFWT